MNKTWLIIDGNNICHMAYHAMGNMSTSKDVKTGIIFGFFNSISYYMSRFQTANIIFCFDHGPLLRENIYPQYKKRKYEKAIEDNRAFVRSQASLLKTQILYEIGFNNVLYKKGYEADDLIAECARVITSTSDDHVIAVSDDQDLYQILTSRVDLYKPRAKVLYTLQHLFEQYKIYPDEWVDAKAIAGCDSDNIQGVDRVGIKTACKYITGSLPKHHQSYRNIRDNQPLLKRNMNLVKLPFPGAGPVLITDKDGVTKEKWNKVVKDFEMTSLIDKPPIPARVANRRSMFDG